VCDPHFARGILCEYGIRGRRRGSHVSKCHGRDSVRRKRTRGLSESCGQSESGIGFRGSRRPGTHATPIRFAPAAGKG
jgi:hypothetical protein